VGALSVRAGMIAASAIKEAHSSQKTDLTTVRCRETFRESMDHLLRVWCLHCVHHTFEACYFSNTIEISIAGTEPKFPAEVECPCDYEHRLAKKKGRWS
jgi:hypothetical protein